MSHHIPPHPAPSTGSRLPPHTGKEGALYGTVTCGYPENMQRDFIEFNHISRKPLLKLTGLPLVPLQCFDLESYLQLNCERGTWRCPVCKYVSPVSISHPATPFNVEFFQLGLDCLFLYFTVKRLSWRVWKWTSTYWESLSTFRSTCFFMCALDAVSPSIPALLF